MRRTLCFQQMPAADVRRGEVVVATGYVHPERGAVRCGAATLLVEALARAGHRVRKGQMTISDGVCRDDGVMFAVSYIDHGGQVSGFGVAADPRDRSAVTVARRTALEWSRVLRSRRLLLSQTTPTCWGADRSVGIIMAGVISDGPPVYVLGRPAIRDRDVADLAVRGVQFVDDLAAVPKGARVALPAQGAPSPTRVELAARGGEVIDGTCPLVSAGVADVRSYVDRGDTVVLIGGRDHAAAKTFAAEGGASVVMVHDVGDLARLEGIDAERVSFVVQTGFPVEDAAPVVEALRARYPSLHGYHYDVWCYAASDRAETIRSVADASDVVLVAGTTNDDDAAHVATMARHAGTRVCLLDTVGGLADGFVQGWLARAGTIGLVTTRSAPRALGAEITRALAGLGPLSVVARRTSTSTVGLEEAAVPSDWQASTDLAIAMTGAD